MRELDHVRQRREVAQLEVLIARNVVGRADRREHLRLLDGVNAEVGFQIEIEVQHVLGIAGLLGHNLQDLFLDRSSIVGCSAAQRGCDVGRALARRCSTGAGVGSRSCSGQVRPLLIHELDHVRQRRIVAQLAVLVARNVVDLADGREHLRLLDGVDAEVGFEIEVQIQHVFRIAGLLHHQLQDAFLHGLAGVSVWRSGNAVLVQPAGRCRQSSTAGSFGDGRATESRSARSGRFSYTKRMTCARVG